jgi:hypothetical protein
MTRVVRSAPRRVLRGATYDPGHSESHAGNINIDPLIMAPFEETFCTTTARTDAPNTTPVSRIRNAIGTP